MKRAQWYVVNAGGWWRRCRTPFRCDHAQQFGLRCEHVVENGELYLDTNSPKFPDATDGRRFVKKRLCFACADEQLETRTTGRSDQLSTTR